MKLNARPKPCLLVCLLALALVVAAAPTARAGETEDGRVDFSRDIRPILSENCFACHGPDEHDRKAKLRLDTKEGAFGDRGGYAAVVPGDLKASELWYLVSNDDPDMVMPPPKSRKKLTRDQIELLRRWIEQGAPWAGHWSFEPPVKAPLPETKHGTWARNAIDHYVLARLEAKGLTPAAPADKRTLIRRVTFDLTGLPPTIDEVRAFVEDDSADAYEKVVDRLLASPRFGEHRARYWLDVARYGDTHGLHLDNYREMWPYRDWVINAFNRNLPYDRFVTEQLAGDLLDDATLEQRIATGFNRAHVTTAEGGSIAKEVYTRNVFDRVDTFGTALLGLTVGCAKCHDHKFDAISQAEYYSLFAFFNSLDANPLDGNKKDHEPVARVPTTEQKQQLAELEKQIAAVDAEIRAKLASVNYEEPAEPTKPQQPAPTEYVWIDDAVPAGANPQGNSPWQWVTKDKGPVHSGERSHTRTAAGLSQHFFTGASKPLKVGKSDKLFTYVFIDKKNPPKEIMLQWNDGSWEHRAYWGGNHIEWGGDGTPSRRPMGKLPEAGKWVRLEVDAQHVGLQPGAQINGWAFTQFDGTVHWDKAGIVSQTDQQPTYDSLAMWAEDQRKLEKPDVPADIHAIIKLDADKRTTEQQKKLTDYFVERVYTKTRGEFEPLHQKFTKLNQQIEQVEKSFPTTLVWKETDKPRPAFVLKRGEYDQETDPVSRQTPSALPPFPADAPRDRLGLAKWLTQKNHPLTARVAVNRYWQQLFGVGLVKTTEDFGSQGEPPSHPKLLDFLAVEFVESGWDVKQLFKTIVTSSIYRQASTVTKEKLAKDRENRLLSRGPRFRLDAEMLRDQALFVSGQLVEQIGGPSVKPPQPPGLWYAVGYSGSNTVRFTQDEGEKTYRRSLYTFWKRTAPPPQMSIADAPSRESCTVRRERTNTPLLALLLMNEQQYVESARRLAQLAVKRSGAPEDRASWMFERATLRPPSEADLADLLGLYRDALTYYKADGEAAKKLIHVGDSKPDESIDAAELAAWTMVGNLILNLDEVVTKN